MKKKNFLVPLIAFVLMTNMLFACSSNNVNNTNVSQNSESKQSLSEGEYQYIAANDVLKAKDVHILDVRE